MFVVVTGAAGKVGTAAVEALQAAGHAVRATDTARGVFERPEPGAPEYWQTDLTDAGDAFAVVRGADTVVHAAAIPDPSHNPPHVVFHNNTQATFNIVEAAVRWGVRRLVNISSETVSGYVFAERRSRSAARFVEPGSATSPERPDTADYVPVDENHPIRPQDPYALSKYVGELLCDAAVRRSDLRCISLRPSWVQHAGNYERNLGPIIREPQPSANLWSYIDAEDLADAIRLAVESDLPGHEVMYIAAADNSAGRPLDDLIARFHDGAVAVRDLTRDDASGISTARAQRLLGWTPKRSWRDHLDTDGRPL